jgi:hypothetical protein
LCKLLLHLERFKELTKITVTVVAVGEALVDGDRVVAPKHLRLEVGEVGYYHEPREHQSQKYGMVLRRPVDYLEVDLLSPEVIWFAEDDA